MVVDASVTPYASAYPARIFQRTFTRRSPGASAAEVGELSDQELKRDLPLLTARLAARTVSPSSAKHMSLFCLKLSMTDHDRDRTTHEENLSTEQPEAKTYPWVQGAHGNNGWPPSAQAQAGEGAHAPDTLIQRVPAVLAVQSSARFSRRHRLTHANEFGRVFAHSVRSTDAYFTVLARAGTCDNPRLGLAISKRVAKSAFARNRLRRLSRETFRQLELPPWDFVVMAREKAPTVENRVLRQSLQRHFNRIARQARAERDE